MDNNLNCSNKYFIHDNGGRPYMVCIISNYKLYIYKYNTTRKIHTDLIGVFEFTDLFIGYSDKNDFTEFGGGYGPKFQGNTILIRTPQYNKLEYVYIGATIDYFYPKRQIVTYFSPVGNNDVPYPYAVDDMDNYYLILFNVVLQIPSKYKSNPNEYCMEVSSVGHYCRPQNIRAFLLGGKKHDISYSELSSLNYDDIIETFGMPEIIMSNGNKIPLSKEQYNEIVIEYAKCMGIEPINIKNIHPRT